MCELGNNSGTTFLSRAFCILDCDGPYADRFGIVLRSTFDYKLGTPRLMSMCSSPVRQRRLTWSGIQRQSHHVHVFAAPVFLVYAMCDCFACLQFDGSVPVA